MAENRPLKLVGDYPCDQAGCDHTAKRPQALGLHKRHAHGIRGASRDANGVALPSSKRPKVEPSAPAPALPVLGDHVQITLLAFDPETGQVTIGLDGRWRAVLT